MRTTGVRRLLRGRHAPSVDRYPIVVRTAWPSGACAVLNRGWRLAGIAMSSSSARYRIPTVFRDLVMVDLLELTGSTVATADTLALSQPSISRRYRSIARELGLERDNSKPPGRRFSDRAWMLDLRRAVNRHRLDCGVVRVGGPPAMGASLERCDWVEWVPLGPHQRQHWNHLLQLELLDAVAVDPAQPALDTGGIPPAIVTVGTGTGAALQLACRNDALIHAIVSRGLGASHERDVDHEQSHRS